MFKKQNVLTSTSRVIQSVDRSLMPKAFSEQQSKKKPKHGELSVNTKMEIQTGTSLVADKTPKFRQQSEMQVNTKRQTTRLP
jgi:hypothetical protein